MNASITVRNAEQYQTSVWSGGTTTQLFIYPEDGDYKEGTFQARISSATVELQKSSFTSLPGVKRYLMTLKGHLDMIHGVNTKAELEPYEVDCFDGGVPTVSYGKVTDFNLMLKNGADGRMEAAILEAGQSCMLEPEGMFDLLAVYVGEGCICVSDHTVKEGELLLCQNWEEALAVQSTGDTAAKLGICKVKKANKDDRQQGRRFGEFPKRRPFCFTLCRILYKMECRSNRFFGKEKIVSTVQIYVLQTPQILLDGEQVILPYKKAEALLFYMAIEKKATRDQIAALLWDSCDEATAKKNLRHALYTIRKIFHTDLVSSPTRQTLELNPETYVSCGLRCIHGKKRSVSLPGGASGRILYKKCVPLRRWLTMKRGLAKEAFLRAIYEKMQSEADLSVAEGGKPLFERYVQEDPLDERVYLRMMEIYESAHLY